MDVIIPYKKTATEELRYTLRGLKNIEHDKVFLLGDKPEWVQNVEHIPRKSPAYDRYQDVESLIVSACHSDKVSDDFILMNDDMFILEKSTIPHWYIDTISKEYVRRSYIGFSPYVKGYKHTDTFLKNLGIKEPLDYCLHIPMVMNKTKRLIVSELRSQRLKNNEVLLSRSLYGNLFTKKGTKHPDVKYSHKDDNFTKYKMLSTLDSSFNSGKIGVYIRSKLTEKSIYERRVPKAL